MARRQREIAGRIVAITGAGRGIGAATAQALVDAGARVAIGDLDENSAKLTADALGPNALSFALDVADAASYTAFLDAVETQLGPIDVLINNAGIMPVADFATESQASINRQLQINLSAVIHGCQEAIARMTPRGGHIVNVASAAGLMGFPGVATYCATKHGVVGLSEALYRELHGTGINISCVMPGVVRTELTAGIAEHWLLKSIGPEEVAAAIVATLRRPKLDVPVPKLIGFMDMISKIMPRTVLESSLRAIGGDHFMADAAHTSERAAYETRAAAQDIPPDASYANVRQHLPRDG